MYCWGEGEGGKLGLAGANGDTDYPRKVRIEFSTLLNKNDYPRKVRIEFSTFLNKNDYPRKVRIEFSILLNKNDLGANI